MRYESIADIYSANQKIRGRFLSVVNAVTADEATALPEGENWPIQQIVEHVAIVNNGMNRICSKLIGAAKQTGETSDGSFVISSSFQERLDLLATRKAEAPERVRPTGEIPIDASLTKLAEASDAFESMRADMESTKLTGHTFPHPYFGDLTASEWLVLYGLHEARHTQQIERLLEKIRQ